MFRPAFWCAQHPKAIRNTQQYICAILAIFKSPPTSCNTSVPQGKAFSSALWSLLKIAFSNTVGKFTFFVKNIHFLLPQLSLTQTCKEEFNMFYSLKNPNVMNYSSKQFSRQAVLDISVCRPSFMGYFFCLPHQKSGHPCPKAYA